MENPEKDGGPPDLGDSDSDTEADVNVLFPRYKDLANGISWERRQKREARERLAEEARERLDESRRAQPIEAGTPAKAGSSVDLPLAADEPGIADCKHEDTPGAGKAKPIRQRPLRFRTCSGLKRGRTHSKMCLVARSLRRPTAAPLTPRGCSY